MKPGKSLVQKADLLQQVDAAVTKHGVTISNVTFDKYQTNFTMLTSFGANLNSIERRKTALNTDDILVFFEFLHT